MSASASGRLQAFLSMKEKLLILCNEIEHGTDEYRQTVSLRDEILRRPLNLAFSPKELAEEKDSFHIACWRDGKLTACLILKPLSDRQVRLRQLAIMLAEQGAGIGSALVVYSEGFARKHGYHEIVLHARHTAVGFYEKLGYQTVGAGFTEINIQHFLMRKALGNAAGR
jgi:N-acetylglutamate synthase-like GNAT family acetyltransferase